LSVDAEQAATQDTFLSSPNSIRGEKLDVNSSYQNSLSSKSQIFFVNDKTPHFSTI